MESTTDLVEALVARQRGRGESDREFARRIGMSRQAWQLTRTRGMRPGRRTLQGVSRAFPDLVPVVLAFLLADNASIVNDDASMLTESEAAG